MQHYTPQGLAYDEERSAYLEGLDLKVIRFHNEEVDEAFYLVRRKITEIADERLETPKLLPVEGAVTSGD